VGVLGSLGKFAKKAAKETGKAIKTSAASLEQSNEIRKARKAILLSFSIEELKGIAVSCGLDASGYIEEFGEDRKRKMNRVDWINHVSGASSEKIIFALKTMHKSGQASDLERAVNMIKDKYNLKKQEIREGKREIKHESSELLDSMVDIIVKTIREFQPFKENTKESLYQTDLGGYLKGVLPTKFGKAKIYVGKEMNLPKDLRIDLLLETSGYKIGIETKFDLTSSGQVQRLLGQIMQYSENIDALVVSDSHAIDKEEAIDALKKIKEKSEIPLRIIAGGNEIH